MIPLVDRLQKKLKVMSNGCWEWQGTRNKCGHGRIWHLPSASKIYTHRAMWEIVFNLIPDGLCVLHSCDNPPCCNPAHLFLGTKADNMADMIAKGRDRKLKGEEAPNSKLTWDQVRAIRADNRSSRKIGSEYGIDYSNVSRIKRGESWKEDE